jgi:hypothetical protein
MSCPNQVISEGLPALRVICHHDIEMVTAVDPTKEHDRDPCFEQGLSLRFCREAAPTGHDQDSIDPHFSEITKAGCLDLLSSPAQLELKVVTGSPSCICKALNELWKVRIADFGHHEPEHAGRFRFEASGHQIDLVARFVRNLPDACLRFVTYQRTIGKGPRYGWLRDTRPTRYVVKRNNSSLSHFCSRLLHTNALSLADRAFVCITI